MQGKEGEGRGGGGGGASEIPQHQSLPRRRAQSRARPRSFAGPGAAEGILKRGRLLGTLGGSGGGAGGCASRELCLEVGFETFLSEESGRADGGLWSAAGQVAKSQDHPAMLGGLAGGKLVAGPAQ